MKVKVDKSVLAFLAVAILLQLTFSTELHAKDQACEDACRIQVVNDLLDCVVHLDVDEANCVTSSATCSNGALACVAQYWTCISGANAQSVACGAAAEAALVACLEGCEGGEEEGEESEEE